MICKNCGKEIKWDLASCKLNSYSYPTAIPTCYKGYSWIKICGKCNAVIDYKDLTIDDFFSWLNICDEGQCLTNNLKGKALIRYFELDKLLEPKKETGD